MNDLERICVFCGANAGHRPVYATAAVALGQELVRRGLGLVYGGGSVGLMGVLARAVRDAGGQVIGVIPAALTTRELMGETIGDLLVVETMHERKAKMAALAGGFIALPGGFGTLDELFEAITWSQLGIHTKPIGLLNVDGFFDPLLAFIDHGVAEGFIRPQHRRLVEVVDTDPVALLDRLAHHEAPRGLVQWLSPDQV
jgi:uncharacterized protein (TIGR00730 family)